MTSSSSEAVDVWLTGVGPRKILVIKTLRALLGTGLAETKRLTDNAPFAVLEGADAARADYAASELTRAGASVEQISQGDRCVIIDPHHAARSAQHVERLLRQGATLVSERAPMGQSGPQREVRFAGEVEAREAFEERIREAEAQGLWVCANDGEALTGLSPRDAELEAQLAAAPDDLDLLEVYADWLDERGDPRGELIALGVRGSRLRRDHPRRRRDRRALEERADELRATMRGSLLGALAPYHGALELSWRHGFIDACRLPPQTLPGELHPLGSPYAPEVLGEGLLAALFALPTALLLRRLRITRDIEATLRALDRLPHSLEALRCLELGSGTIANMGGDWLGPLKALPRIAPRLESLSLWGAYAELGRIELPALRHLSCRVQPLDNELLAHLRRARWPRLERFELWLAEGGEAPPAKQLTALCAGRLDLPELRELRLYQSIETDELLRALCRGSLAPRLEILNLSGGTIGVEGLNELIEAAPRFGALRELHLTDALPRRLGRRLELRRALPNCKTHI